MANNGEMKWRKWRHQSAISKIMKAYESMKAAMAMAKKVIGQRISSKWRINRAGNNNVKASRNHQLEN
jgi:hypothetical protein